MENKKNTRALKKLIFLSVFVIFVFGFFLVNFSGGEESYEGDVEKINNQISYKNNNLTVEFKDGENILGQATLKSHKTYDEVLKVTTGKNKTVIWYELSQFKEDQLNAIGDVEFIDMREKIANETYTKQFDGNLDLMDESLVLISNPNYLKPVNKNYKFVYQDEKGDWIDYDLKDIPKENIIIGVQTDLFWGEFLDVRLNILGNKLDRHSIVFGVSSGFVTTAPIDDPKSYYRKIMDNGAPVTGDISPTNAIRVTEIGWWCGTATQESNFEVGIYEDDGGVPRNLLYSNVTNAKGIDAGWKKVTGLNWSISGNTKYWIGVQLDKTATTTNTDFYRSGGFGVDFGPFKSTLPNPFGGGELYDSNAMLSFYAIYEAGGDSIPPHFTTIPANTTINYTQGFGVDFDATDETGFESYAINWTTLFQINQSGWLENSTTNIPVGTYEINVTINDTSNNLNSTIYKVTVDKSSPEGSLTNTDTWTEPYLESVTIGLSESNIGDGDITYVVYRDGVSKTTGETVTLGVGTYNYVLNTTGGANWTANASMDAETLTVTQIASQTSLTFDVASPQTYGTAITPTCSVISGESSAVLKQDGNVITSGVAITLGANTYSFNCSLDATQNYTASSNSSNYIISKATPSGSLAGSTSPINYLVAGDVEGTEANTGDGGCLYKLYREGVEVSNPDNDVLGVGVWNYIYNTTGCTNYSASASLDTFVLTVDKISPSPNMGITGTTPIIYPATSDFSESETNTGDGGCSYSMDRGNQVYGVGVWTFNYSTTGCDNYTAGSVTKDLTINQNTTYVLSITGTTPIVYGTTTNVAGGDCPAELSCSLDKANAVYGVGIETFNYSTPGNTNYSANSITKDITITQASLSVSITNDRADTFTYDGTPANIGISESNTGDGDVTYILWKDNVNVGSSDAQAGAGAFNYKVNSTGGTNYSASASLDTLTLTINQASSQTNLTFDKTSPQDYGTEIIPYCSIITGEGSAVLEMDGEIITSGVGITLGAGTYSFNCSLAESTNYTYSENVSDFTIDKATPSIDIDWTSPITYGTPSDAYGIETNDGDGDVSYNLYRENSPGSGVFISVSDPDNSILQAGLWDYKLEATGGANYSQLNLTKGALTVNQAIPEGSLTSSGGWIIEEGDSVTIGLSETNTGDGDLTYEIFRDGVSIGTGEIWSPSLGSYSYILNTTGGTNYTENSSMDAQTLDVQDNTNPLIEFSNGTELNNTFFNRDWIFINVSVTETNEDTIIFNLYNSSLDIQNSTSFTDGTRTINWTNLTDGLYYYNVSVNDTSGNSNQTETRLITLDGLFGNILIISPVEGYNVKDYVSGSVPIIANISIAEDNLDSCWYEVSGSQTISNTSFTCSEGYNNFTFQISTYGSFTFITYANDSAGNEESDNMTFTISKYTGPEKSSGSTGYDGTPEEEPEEAKFYNQSTMCFYVGNYLTNNNSDVESLRNVLNIEFGFAVTDKILDYYLEDYYELCGLEEPIPNMVYEETKSYKVFYIVCILVLLMIAFVIFFIKRIERLEKIKGRNF